MKVVVFIPQITGIHVLANIALKENRRKQQKQQKQQKEQQEQKQEETTNE